MVAVELVGDRRSDPGIILKTEPPDLLISYKQGVKETKKLRTVLIFFGLRH